VRRTLRTDDGLGLEVVEFGGDGPPILLMHGLMGRATTWWSHAQWLVGHGRVLGHDARGHGRSEARGPWTTERMVADAACVLADVGPAVVIGHSMGALHALVLAARHPGLVRAVVAEDIAVDFRGRSADDARAWFGALPRTYESLAHVRQVFGHPRPEFGEYMAECAAERAGGYELLAATEHTTEIAAEWARLDHWDVLPLVACPALLIEAQESVAPPGHMAEMAARMPDARHVVLPGTGHLAHDADPSGYRANVKTFLSGW
jgi:pimeloyl-ACP methyl ester carboxylesterase